MPSHNLGSASLLLMGNLSLGIERPVLEAEHSCPSSVEVTNAPTGIAAPINTFTTDAVLHPDVPSLLYSSCFVRHLFNRHNDDDDDMIIMMIIIIIITVIITLVRTCAKLSSNKSRRHSDYAVESASAN